MKIIIDEIPSEQEECIVIRCHTVDDSVLSLVKQIQSKINKNTEIIGYQEEMICRLREKDIYYFEAIDNHVFAYAVKEVYTIKQKLYELEQIMNPKYFFRASRSVLLNFEKIDAIRPVLYGRFEAVLNNGEKVVISRQYVPMLKKLLGL